MDLVILHYTLLSWGYYYINFDFMIISLASPLTTRPPSAFPGLLLPHTVTPQLSHSLTLESFFLPILWFLQPPFRSLSLFQDQLGYQLPWEASPAPPPGSHRWLFYGPWTPCASALRALVHHAYHLSSPLLPELSLSLLWLPSVNCSLEADDILSTYHQKVNSSPTRHHNAYITRLTSSQHVGILSSHITRRSSIVQ